MISAQFLKSWPQICFVRFLFEYKWITVSNFKEAPQGVGTKFVFIIVSSSLSPSERLYNKIPRRRLIYHLHKSGTDVRWPWTKTYKMQSVHPWVQVNRFVEFEKNFSRSLRNIMFTWIAWTAWRRNTSGHSCLWNNMFIKFIELPETISLNVEFVCNLEVYILVAMM